MVGWAYSKLTKKKVFGVVVFTTTKYLSIQLHHWYVLYQFVEVYVPHYIKYYHTSQSIDNM